jgi:hypothetical protein
MDWYADVDWYLLINSERVSTMCGGIFIGLAKPNQPDQSYPGTLSEMGGTFGSKDERQSKASN